jgi:hypothetical protein
MGENLKRAIWLTMQDGMLEVWNYSSIGEGERRDGVESVYAFLQRQHGVTTESMRRNRGGSAWHQTSVVRDRDGLVAAAAAAGIEMANNWIGWSWP